MTWDNREKVKGCEVYFSTMFSWPSPLSDRNVSLTDPTILLYPRCLQTTTWLLSDSSFYLLVLQEGSCIISGLSYNGRTKDGKVMWDGLRNIKVSVYETMYTFQVRFGTFFGSLCACASFSGQRSGKMACVVCVI